MEIAEDGTLVDEDGTTADDVAVLVAVPIDEDEAVGVEDAKDGENAIDEEDAADVKDMKGGVALMVLQALVPVVVRNGIEDESVNELEAKNIVISRPIER